MPTAAIRARRTTKTLATVIHQLFERSGLTGEEFARDIGLKRSSLYHLFKGTNGIKYKVLEKIERRLGVPTGIILCISHSASLIREARYNPDAKKRAVASRGLSLMADYLANLHAVLTEPPLHSQRVVYVSGKRHDNDKWIAAIDEIMDATQNNPDRTSPTAFTDPAFAAPSVSRGLRKPAKSSRRDALKSSADRQNATKKRVVPK